MGNLAHPFQFFYIDKLVHSLVVKNVGLEAAREEAKKVLEIKYEPKGDVGLSQPKFGKDDPNNSPHTGGNTWAGGVNNNTTS